MSRTAKLELDGVSYTLLFSTRVMETLEEEHGTFAEAMGKITMVSEKVHLLALLMEAGYKYDLDRGHKNAPDPLSEDEIRDGIALPDYEAINLAIDEAIRGGTARKVEAKPKPKKGGGATQAE